VRAVIPDNPFEPFEIGIGPGFAYKHFGGEFLVGNPFGDEPGP
jgi:hypothetical protein